MKIFRRRRIQTRVAFLKQEQALASLSMLFLYYDYNKSIAKIRNGRGLDQCQFLNLELLARESGFDLSKVSIDVTSLLQRNHSPVIVDLINEGTVILEKSTPQSSSIYNPLTGWKSLPSLSYLIDNNLMNTDVLVFKSRSRLPQYLKGTSTSNLFIQLLTDQSIKVAGLCVVFLSLLHALTKLTDPIVKNLFMTIVVQSNDISWARSLSWIYFFVGILGSFILLLSSIVSILLLTRLALKYSFSTLSNLLRVPTRYLAIRQNGDLLNRVRSSEAIAGFIGTTEIALLSSLINLVILVSFLATTSLILAILLFCFQCIGFLISIRTASPLKRRTDMHVQRVAQETSSFISHLSDVRTVHRQSRSNFVFRNHQIKINSRIHAQQDLSVFSIILSSVNSSLDSIQSAVLLTVAAILIIEGDVSLGQYVAFSAIMSNVIQPFKNISSFVSKFQHIRTIEERVSDISDESLLMEGQLENVHLPDALISINLTSVNTESEIEPFVVSSIDLPAVLITNTFDEIEILERYLSGDDRTPSDLKIRLLSIESGSNVLIARSNAHLFNLGWFQNIFLWFKPLNIDDSARFYSLVKSIYSPDDVDADVDNASSLSQSQLSTLGCLRALWLRPDYIILPISNYLKGTQKQLFCQSVLNYCGKHNIQVLFISDSSEGLDSTSQIITPAFISKALNTSNELIS